VSSDASSTLSPSSFTNLITSDCAGFNWLKSLRSRSALTIAGP